jgi:hypothetical protein
MSHLEASDESGDDFGAISFSGQPRVHDGDEDEEVRKADGAESETHNGAALKRGEKALGGGANAAHADTDVGFDGRHHADVAAEHLRPHVGRVKKETGRKQGCYRGGRAPKEGKGSCPAVGGKNLMRV